MRGASEHRRSRSGSISTPSRSLARGEVNLVGVLDLGQALEHHVGTDLSESQRHGGSRTTRRAGDLVERGGQAGVTTSEPAARVTPLILLLKRSGQMACHSLRVSRLMISIVERRRR